MKNNNPETQPVPHSEHTPCPFNNRRRDVAENDRSSWQNYTKYINTLRGNLKNLFYICSYVHRNSRLKKSNEMQQYADIYLLLNYSTCFGRPSRPSSGVHKTVGAASGTDHTIWGASFLKRDQIRTDLGPSLGCNYSFIYSWWWARRTPETCRVI